MPELDGYGRHEILHMAWFLSRFRLPCGRCAEAPAADLVTARVVSRTPEIPPERRRYADFSGALHCHAGRGGAA